MTASAKDTIYIDAEDEITAIIEKVRASDAKIVALVLPKRSQTLQSIVNLKLLNRTAKAAKKNLVLITSDPNLLPIAGAVGLHVAKTPQSKPTVPAAPARQEEALSVEAPAETAEDEEEPVLDKTAPVGVLAGEETIDLDNDADATKAVAAATGAKKSKTLFNKKLKVPDFDRFRLMLFGGGALLILLIVGGIFAFVVLPKATINVKTDTSNVATELNLTARAGATELDKENKIVPAIKKELKKTENEKAPATGKRDDGTKSTGSMTITNCSASVAEIPSGTIFIAGDKRFVSTAAGSVPKSGYSNTPGGFVCNNDGTKSVPVIAESAGDSYNLGSRAYTISGGPTNVSASGSNMTGGTSKLVQVVAQADIDTAKARLLERLNTVATAELKAQFVAENMIALDDTYGAGEPVVASTPNVNDEAAEVTVTVTISYTELGVKKDDLKTLVEESVNKQIDSSKQSIQDNGLDKATIRVLDKKSPDEAVFSVSTISVAGPQLDAEAIKKEIAGQKKGATIKAIEARPGIEEAEVTYSPFWVFSTPKRTNRITINFDQGND